MFFSAVGLGIFDKLYTIAHDEISEVQAVLKNFNKTNYDEQLADLESNVNILSLELYNARKVYKLAEKDANRLQRDILKLNQKIKPVDETITDIKLLRVCSNCCSIVPASVFGDKAFPPRAIITVLSFVFISS